MAILVGAATIFGVGCMFGALMPNAVLFGLTLAVIGASTQTFTTSTNSLVQISTEPAMRGRVIAILLAIGHHAAWRASGGVGGGPLWSALGAGRWGGFGFAAALVDCSI
jgi:hypothetical protein